MEDFLYSQSRIPKNQWRYGLRSSAAVGCGWIATYNALQLMGFSPEPEEIIRAYERQLPLIHGNMGTTVLAPAVYFLRRGFRVEYLSRPDRFADVVKRSDAAIVFYRWRKGWRFGAHFVAVSHTEKGFVGYNTFPGSTGPDLYGESLRDFLKRKNYFGAVVIGIEKNNRKAGQKE